MSSSADGGRGPRRGPQRAKWFALAIAAAALVFALLPHELQASLGEIAYFAAVGIPLLVLVMFWGFPSMFDLSGWVPRGPRADPPRRANLTDGWPPKAPRAGDAKERTDA
jgi:hypothetical protein